MGRAVLTLATVFALLAAAVPSGAHAGADDPEIVFDPPLSVNIRQTNGVAARGEVLTMNDKELVLRSVSGKEVRLKLERIRSIKTSNEQFEYWPDQETFSELCARVDEVPGAALMGDIEGSTGKSPRRAATNRKPAAEDESGGDEEGAAAGESPRNGGKLHGKKLDEQVARQQNLGRGRPEVPAKKNSPLTVAADSGESATDTEPEPGSVIYSCSNCQKELPVSFRSGDACPHCGKVAVLEEESAASAAQSAPAVPANSNPFATAGPATTPAVMPAAAAPAPVAVAAPSSGGLGLSDMPVYAKIGIFAAFLIVGYFVLNRR